MKPGHEQENHRRYRVSPGTVGPRQIGMRDAQLDHAEHGEERAEQQRELDEVEHRLEAARKQHQARDRKLKQDGVSRRAAGRPSGERPQHRNVLAHRHHDARPDPHHRADRGDQPEADHRADDAAAEFAEDVAAGNPGDVELACELVDRRGMQEHRVERDIQHQHDQRSDQHRPRHVALGQPHLADDVGRRVPSRERIHHEHEADRERRADDMGEVGGRWRKRYRLRRADHKAADQEGHDQHDLQDGRDQLKGRGVPDAGELHQRHQPDHADRQRQRRRI